MVTDDATPAVTSSNSTIPEMVGPRQTTPVLTLSGGRGVRDPDNLTEPRQAQPTSLLDFDKLRPDWFADAACHGAGNADWFDTDGAGATRARQVCQRCTVLAQCLAYAVADPQLTGIWGGLSARERGRLRRQQRGAA